MIKKVLKGIAVILVLLVLTILFLYLNLSDPYGPLPGGRLQGEEVTEPVTDWSFVQEYGILTSEVRPSSPYSIHSGYVFHDGVIYLSSGLGARGRWPYFLLENPNMRLRIGDKLYPVRATRVEDPALFDAIHDTRDSRNPNRPPRTAEERAKIWFFRIDSR